MILYIQFRFSNESNKLKAPFSH